MKKLFALALLLGALFSAACASSRLTSPNPRPDPLDGFGSQRYTHHRPSDHATRPGGGAAFAQAVALSRIR